MPCQKMARRKIVSYAQSIENGFNSHLCKFYVQVLPTLSRVMGLEIPGGAFSDLLMVQEFVHNFGEALDLGKRSALEWSMSKFSLQCESVTVTNVQILLTLWIGDGNIVNNRLHVEDNMFNSLHWIPNSQNKHITIIYFKELKVWF